MSPEEQKRTDEARQAARDQLNKEMSAFHAYDDSAHWDTEANVTKVNPEELVANLEKAGWVYQPKK